MEIPKKEETMKIEKTQMQITIPKKEFEEIETKQKNMIHFHFSSGKIIDIKFDLKKTIKNIKQEIENLEGIPQEQQRFVLKGRELLDDKSLAELEIKKNETIEVFIVIKKKKIIKKEKSEKKESEEERKKEKIEKEEKIKKEVKIKSSKKVKINSSDGDNSSDEESPNLPSDEEEEEKKQKKKTNKKLLEKKKLKHLPLDDEDDEDDEDDDEEEPKIPLNEEENEKKCCKKIKPNNRPYHMLTHHHLIPKKGQRRWAINAFITKKLETIKNLLIDIKSIKSYNAVDGKKLTDADLQLFSTTDKIEDFVLKAAEQGNFNLKKGRRNKIRKKKKRKIIEEEEEEEVVDSDN